MVFSWVLFSINLLIKSIRFNLLSELEVSAFFSKEPSKSIHTIKSYELTNIKKYIHTVKLRKSSFFVGRKNKLNNDDFIIRK